MTWVHDGLSRPTMAVHDAIHGTIDISTPSETRAPSNTIELLLTSAPLQRLSGIKQLDFALWSYPGATHTRFSHAVGTMHSMRLLIQHLTAIASPWIERACASAAAAFPDLAELDGETLLTLVSRHLLLAALLQDIGELPYAHATKHFFRPSDDVMDMVRNGVEADTFSWSTKRIMTAAVLMTSEAITRNDDVHLPLLLALTVGCYGPESRTKLRPLLNMLDGVIDADRLDYVYRDTHYTGIGTDFNLHDVISSIADYDEAGPIVSDPGPISLFFVRRAYLYDRVYLNPSNRFRIQLLLSLLRNSTLQANLPEPIRSQLHQALTVETFADLADSSLDTAFRELSRSPNHRRLDERAKRALRLFVGEGPAYRHTWIARDESDVGITSVAASLPVDLFFDSLADQQGRLLYEPRSVRVSASYYGEIQYMENATGALAGLFKDATPMLPKQDDILMFVPAEQKQTLADWKAVEVAEKEGRLYAWLLQNDPLRPFDFSRDTRTTPGHSGPSIFISFAWADLLVVKEVAQVLFERRRRYFLLIEPYQGVGETPARNSENSIKEADAVILIASTAYAARNRDEPDGNIARELRTVRDRHVMGNKLPVVPLSVGPHETVANLLPWEGLGFDQMPFVGKPLDGAPRSQVREAVAEALLAIDAVFET